MPETNTPSDKVPVTSPIPASDTVMPATAAQQQFTLDESHVQACYANFCRVTGTPEELIIDFAINAHPMNPPDGSKIVVSQRLVTNYYTAKRLWAALGMSLQRHEVVFGVLETDVQKRVKRA